MTDSASLPAFDPPRVLAEVIISQRHFFTARYEGLRVIAIDDARMLSEALIAALDEIERLREALAEACDWLDEDLAHAPITGASLAADRELVARWRSALEGEGGNGDQRSGSGAATHEPIATPGPDKEGGKG